MERKEELLEELLEVHRKMRRRRPRKPLANCHPAAFMTLVAIQDYCEETPEARGISVGELAERLEVSMPAVSKMLRTLEERGWAIRLTDEQNRRMVYVNVTEAGKVLLTEAKRQERADVQAMIDMLGEADAKEWVRIAKRLIDWKIDRQEGIG